MCGEGYGGFEAWTPVCVEPTLKYHPLMFDVLTWTRYPGCGQCLVVVEV